MVKLFESGYMDIQYNNSPWSPTMMEPLAELGGGDNGFEPQQRARSNTWPLPRPENYVDPPDDTASNKCVIDGIQTSAFTGGAVVTGGTVGVGVGVGGVHASYNNNNTIPSGNLAGTVNLMGGSAVVGGAKKNSSRRNAWGNLSYADLITQAITSAPDKRLTLSQIYEWMVTNVPYFKDKGDSNSSAGWKNSIRHNLSLHNRFMRVQNEGTGKSSWWMINPDAKPGKSVRRRAASMETSKFEKRRGRVKKKVEALRNGIAADATPSPSSSIEGLDMFPESPLHSGFQLSPDFRPRASSATSSCGRLSPIPALLGVEPDWSAPSPFPSGGFTTSDSMVGTGSNNGSYSPDQLAGNLEQGMKLQNDYLQGYLNGQPPPAYSATAYDTPFSNAQTHHRDLAASLSSNSQYVLPSQCPIHRLQQCNCMQSTLCKIEPLSPTPEMSPSYSQSEASPDRLATPSPYIMNTSNTTPSSNGTGTPGTPGSTPGGASNDNQQTSNQQQTNHPHQHPRPPSSSPPLTPTPNNVQQSTQQNNGCTTLTSAQLQHASTMMGQLMGALNNGPLLDDLNLNIETLHGFDCNVDEVIKHELSMEGSLDFNFVGGAAGSASHHQHTTQSHFNTSTNFHHHPHEIVNSHHLLGGVAGDSSPIMNISGGDSGSTSSLSSSAAGGALNNSLVQQTSTVPSVSAYSTNSNGGVANTIARSWVH
uniref:Forkhead box protein O n=1 Tax=Chrysopa pallens TaxID=417485 RepID=A0A411JJL6_CHRPA|nr:FoxO [Chrysopa pallens]